MESDAFSSSTEEEEVPSGSICHTYVLAKSRVDGAGLLTQNKQLLPRQDLFETKSTPSTPRF